MIHFVERVDDPRIAAYADVGDHDGLRARGLFVAEGRLVVRRLIEGGRYEIESVLVTPAALEGLRDALGTGGPPVFVCRPELLQNLTGFNFHRGCLALARRSRDAPLPHVAAAKRLLALEAVGNPDNVGGLFRVAAAFGAGGVLLGPGCADPLYRKAIRTSTGAVLQVPYAAAEDWPDVLRSIRGETGRIAALTPHPHAMPLRTFAAAVGSESRVILLLGAEGSGLTLDAMRAADVLVRIPIAAEIDSLNVVVAAGIALAFLHSAD